MQFPIKKVVLSLVGVVSLMTLGCVLFLFEEVTLTLAGLNDCKNKIDVGEYRVCAAKSLDDSDNHWYISYDLGKRWFGNVYRRCGIGLFYTLEEGSKGEIVLQKIEGEDNKILLKIDNQEWKLKIPDHFKNGESLRTLGDDKE